MVLHIPNRTMVESVIHFLFLYSPLDSMEFVISSDVSEEL